MTLVSDGFLLTVSFVDSGNNGTTRSYDLDSADQATAETDAAAVMAALGDVTDAAISGYSLGQKYIEDALVYPTQAEIENTMHISAKLVGRPNRSATINIPAPKITLFTGTLGPSRNIADMSDPALGTFLGLFDATGPVLVSDGESIVVLTATGKRVHKKSNKG